MFSPWYFRLALIATCLVVCLNQVAALNVEYCSNFNTASTNKNSSIYQSNGLCQEFCQSSYAFAVVQDDGCWCSNYVPGTTTNGCTNQCPGYPDDLCGGNGLYGYIALGKAAAGTKGGSSAAPSSTVQQSSTPVPQVTVTSTPNAVTVTTEASSSQAPSSSSTSDTPTTIQAPATTITPTVIQSSPSPSSTPSTSMTWTPTPVISLETTTGSVRTVTVTPTVPPNSQNVVPVSQKSGGGGGLTTGGAVGLTIGLVAVVAIISAIAFVCIKRRRQEKEAEAYNDISRRGSSAGLGGTVPSRTMSENSRYVLGTNGRDVVETWEADENGPPGSRRSRLMPVDPRLDPFAPVYQRGENKSRESVNTLRDDLDYSRRVQQQGPILRATNPDH